MQCVFEVLVELERVKQCVNDEAFAIRMFVSNGQKGMLHVYADAGDDRKPPP